MDTEHGELPLELGNLSYTDSQGLVALIHRLRAGVLALGGLVVQIILQPEVLRGPRAVLVPAALGAERESSRLRPIRSTSWAPERSSTTGSSSTGSLEMPPAADASHRRLATTVATSDYRDPRLHRLQGPGHELRGTFGSPGRSGYRSRSADQTMSLRGQYAWSALGTPNPVSARNPRASGSQRRRTRSCVRLVGVIVGGTMGLGSRRL